MPKKPPISISSVYTKQAGFMLLEALISMLIFSIGILGIVALQALAITNSSENQYRITASLLANQYIGQMWAGDLNPSTLAANFSNGGTNYNSWQTQINAQLPAPTSTVTVTASSTTQSMVTIQINWTMPNGTGHNYQVTDEITQFN